MNKSYPEIYISNEVRQILNKEPQLPMKPQEPQKPSLPKDPGEYDSGGNRGCSALMIVASVVLFIFVCNSDKDNKIGVILATIGSFLCALFLFKTTTWDKDSHEEQRKQYRKDIESYPSRLKEYEVSLERYKTLLSDYDIRFKTLTSAHYLKKFRADLMRSFLTNRDKAPLCKIDLTDSIKIGASEEYFKNRLRSEGFNVLDGFKIKAGTKYFYPDILIEHNGLYLDIEIDEPYSGNDGTPIHYLKMDYAVPYSIDRDRNDFFNKHGFEVIRFCEEQVFRYTDECIQLIIEFTQSLMNGEKYSNPINGDFIKPKWYYEDCAKMAYRRFRKTYVPNEYVKYIDREEQHSYQEIIEEIERNKREQSYSDDLPF